MRPSPRFARDPREYSDWLLAGFLLGGLVGCAVEPPGSGLHPDVSWPYARVAAVRGVPPELEGRAIFAGRWIAANPRGGEAISESGDPRYLLRLPFNSPRGFTFLDLGPDAVIENVGFLDEGRILVLVGAVTLPERGRAAAARALLQFDLEQSLLIDSMPLSRDVSSRGFAVDPVTRRAYLLQDDGAGNGTVQMVSLYGGTRRPAVPVGAIPSGVGRKGLALARNGRMVYCLVGGESARSDFEPVSPEPPAGPELLLLDPDTLGVTGRIALDPDTNPRVVMADPDRDRAYVLAARGSRSRLSIVDAGFGEVRGEIDLPELASDLGMSDGMVIAVCARGVYVVDPIREAITGGIPLPFERTGEIAVSSDGTRAFVQFGISSSGVGPGIALTVLPSGGLVDVLQ